MTRKEDIMFLLETHLEAMEKIQRYLKNEIREINIGKDNENKKTIQDLKITRNMITTRTDSLYNIVDKIKLNLK